MSQYFRQDHLLTQDGAPVYFAVHGEGAPPAVLCDGLGCDGFAWKYLLPQLIADRRVLRWHYRGHGQSGLATDKSRIGVDYLCDDLVMLLDHLEVEKAVLFGHSMGVQVALEFHRRFASRVAGLVLLCGSYGTPLDTWHDHSLARKVFPKVLDWVERHAQLTHALTSRFLKTGIALELAVQGELNPELMHREDFVPYMQHLAQIDPVVFLRTLDSLKDHSAWDHLPNVTAPTLVVGGERDKFTPVWLSQRMARRIPQAQYLFVPEGSHTALLERPTMVNSEVLKFLHARVKA